MNGMAKIVIIGAGSGFGSRLSIDILARASLADSTFVTESTPHNSEYLPYFNRTKELREHYGVASRAPIPMENTLVRDWMKDSGGEQDGDEDVPPLAASH